jgi:hypothetical protein
MIDGKIFRLAGRELTVPGVTLAQLDAFKANSRKQAKEAEAKRKRRDDMQQEILGAAQKLMPGLRPHEMQKKTPDEVEAIVKARLDENGGFDQASLRKIHELVQAQRDLENEIMEEVLDRVNSLKRDLCVAAIQRNYPDYTMEQFLNEAQAADVDAISAYATHGTAWDPEEELGN